MLSRLLHHAPTKRLLLILALLVAVIVLMIRLRISPLSFVSISAISAVLVLIFQTLLQNAVTGIVVTIQGRYPVGSRLAVENAIGTVIAHHLLCLTLQGDDGSVADIPFSKLLADIVFRDVPKPQPVSKE